jgi:hypothetical protein
MPTGGNTPTTLLVHRPRMPLDPIVESRDTTPGAGRALADPAPADPVAGNAGAPGDEAPPRSASMPVPGIDLSGSPTTRPPAGAISTADVLHWFG